MAFSKVTHVASGATDLFSVPFEFLSREHVTVSVNTVDSSFTWESDGQIRLDTTPTNGAIVQVKRNTPKTSPMVDWQNGANIDEPNLDLSTKQSLYITQEAIDEAQSAILEDSDGVFDAENTRIKNLADGVEDTDAATVGQINTFVTQAEGYASDSLASSLIAEGHANDAEQSAAAALALEASTSTLRDEAEGFRNEAEGFATDAQNAIGDVKVSANDTTTSTLEDKITVTGNASISVTNEGGNEKFNINVPSLSKASQTQAEEGTDDSTYMTPLKTSQAIAQLASSSNATESVSGSVELATIAEILSESAIGESGASLAITPATMKQHKGVAKAWAKFDGVSDVIDASCNVSSISDVGTGMYDINYIDDMSSPDYAISATCSVVSGQDGGTTDSSDRLYAGFMNVSRTTVPTASKCRIVHANSYYTPSYEPNDIYVTIHGDLANG